MWKSTFGLVSVCLLNCELVFADDWPQWLGPERDGVWRESGIVKNFPEHGPPLLWRADIGPGYSGPSVAKGRVYVTDRQLGAGAANPADPFTPGLTVGSERVLCLDEADGSILWKHQYECPYTISYPAGPRASPLIDDDRVYTLGAQGNLVCLDARNGQVVWARDLKKDYAIKAPTWGFASHPLVDGRRLVCLVGGAGTTVAAFDKVTGKELWRALSAEEPGYAPPMIYEAGGKRQLIVWHPEAANSLDPESGEIYWSIPFKSNTGLSIATPRKMGDHLFFTTFYNGSMMLHLDSSAPKAAVVWRTEKANERNTTHLNAIMCTPFLENGYIYGVCSYGQLRCLKAENGERLWETFQATTAGDAVRWANAFIVKNGKRFFLYNEKGDLIIAELSPSGYREISRAHLLDPANKDPGRSVVWSHPAFANRRVFVRSDKQIACFNLAADTAGTEALQISR